MGLLSNYIGSFCEVKIASLYKVVCMGHIIAANDESITLNKVILHDSTQNFDAVITVLGQFRGLQVFKATGVTVTNNTISFTSLNKLIDTERRAAYRIAADLQALVTDDENPHIGYDAIIKDISVGGLSLWVHKKFNIDDIVTVQFPLGPDVSSLCICRCNIVRTIGSTNYSLCKYGCEFVSMSDGAGSAIKSFINKKRAALMQQEFFKK